MIYNLKPDFTRAGQAFQFHLTAVMKNLQIAMQFVRKAVLLNQYFKSQGRGEGVALSFIYISII